MEEKGGRGRQLVISAQPNHYSETVRDTLQKCVVDEWLKAKRDSKRKDD